MSDVSINKFYNNHNEYENQPILEALELQQALITPEPNKKEAQEIIFRLVAP